MDLHNYGKWTKVMKWLPTRPTAGAICKYVWMQGHQEIDFTNHEIILVHYYINGASSREDGPAYINRTREEWLLNNRYHCLTGPAIKNYSSPQANKYYLNGTRYRKVDWVKKRKAFLS